MANYQSSNIEYYCQIDLNIYDAPECQRLATQAARGRHLLIQPNDQLAQVKTIEVQLCEDGYPGWLDINDLKYLAIAPQPYVPSTVSLATIEAKIPEAIAFAETAMAQPNQYLWGGTVGPHYDCSGLIQAAFMSVGIWLPRDAYQQEAFTQPILLDKNNLDLSLLKLGDLIFFGTSQKATHVGLYIGNGDYIHSSGKDQGRNGIGIDSLREKPDIFSGPSGDRISQTYYQQLRQAGRIISSYQLPKPTITNNQSRTNE